MIVGVLRSMAKSMAFLTANPSCALKLHWAAYPASKASGVDEATLTKRDLHSIDRQLKPIKEAYALYGKDKVRGAFDTAAWDRLVAFMVRSKQIDKAIPAESVKAKIPDLERRINDFDLAAVQASAKACKF